MRFKLTKYVWFLYSIISLFLLGSLLKLVPDYVYDFLQRDSIQAMLIALVSGLVLSLLLALSLKEGFPNTKFRLIYFKGFLLLLYALLSFLFSVVMALVSQSLLINGFKVDSLKPMTILSTSLDATGFNKFFFYAVVFILLISFLMLLVDYFKRIRFWQDVNTVIEFSDVNRVSFYHVKSYLKDEGFVTKESNNYAFQVIKLKLEKRDYKRIRNDIARLSLKGVTLRYNSSEKGKELVEDL